MNFALIGVAGYVAPRHLQAIKDVGGNLIAALDPHDSVGILDKYFPDCKFFTSQERFDRHISNLALKGINTDYISICSPNYLHESHCKLALRLGANAICEKPLILNPDNINQLIDIQTKTKKKIYNILQLRLHPDLIELKKTINNKQYYNVDLKYITPRGNWYDYSWKGNEKRSGGIETNIGIHFFDMLIWLFGNVERFVIKKRNRKISSGILHLENAKVEWFLSIDKQYLPEGSNFYRSIKVNNNEIRFDNVFSDLHTESYKRILNGDGFEIEDVIKSIELVSNIRNEELK